MSADRRIVKLEVLLIDGAVALFLGLALLYLQRTLTNLLFDVMAVVVALVLCIAAFLMMALVDFLAVVRVGAKQLGNVMFYSIVGLAFAACAALLAVGRVSTIDVLLAFVVVHGLISGSLGMVAAHRTSFSRLVRIVSFCFAAISVSISGVVAGSAGTLDDRSALSWVAFYLCLVGTKLLVLAGCFQRQMIHPARLPLV